jgi:hypothetical protein
MQGENFLSRFYFYNNLLIVIWNIIVANGVLLIKIIGISIKFNNLKVVLIRRKRDGHKKGSREGSLFSCYTV